MWVGTRNHGLAALRDRSFHAGQPRRLEDDFVRSLYEDDEHNLWFGLSSGASLAGA